MKKTAMGILLFAMITFDVEAERKDGSTMLLSTLAQIGTTPVRQIRQTRQSMCVVTGRVVDERGNPVSMAIVVLEPASRQETWESTINYHRTNVRGEFRIEDESSFSTLERVLYVTTALTEDAYAPIAPPFEQMSGADPSFAGRRVTLSKGSRLDLGDVAVQVRYGVVLINL